MQELEDGVLVKTQSIAGGTTKRLTIPRDTATVYWKRIIHSDGRIEFIPQMLMDANAEGAESDK